MIKLITIIILLFIYNIVIFNIKKIVNVNIKNKYYYDFKGIKLSSDLIKKFLDYINKSKNGNILNNKNLIKSEYPKVSIVISMYNRGEFINSTIKSAQNQRMKDLDIIIVDDFSTDNSKKYVEEAQKLDSRISLIKNNKKKGTLFCKSIGVLYSKAKYIHSLDSDDMFCFENYIEILYNESEKGNYDYFTLDYIIIDLHKKTIELVEYKNSVILWKKFIKTEIYKKIIYRIGDNILNRGIIQSDDHFIDLFLKDFQYKHLHIAGIFHFIHYKNHQWEKVFFSNETKIKFCEEIIKTIDSIYTVTENNRKSKLYSFYHLKNFFIKNNCFIIAKIRKKTILTFIKFYKSEFFNFAEKNYIKKLLRTIGVII